MPDPGCGPRGASKVGPIRGRSNEAAVLLGLRGIGARTQGPRRPAFGRSRRLDALAIASPLRSRRTVRPWGLGFFGRDDPTLACHGRGARPDGDPLRPQGDAGPGVPRGPVGGGVRRGGRGIPPGEGNFGPGPRFEHSGGAGLRGDAPRILATDVVGPLGPGSRGARAGSWTGSHTLAAGHPRRRLHGRRGSEAGSGRKFGGGAVAARGFEEPQMGLVAPGPRAGASGRRRAAGRRALGPRVAPERWLGTRAGPPPGWARPGQDSDELRGRARTLPRCAGFGAHTGLARIPNHGRGPEGG